MSAKKFESMVINMVHKAPMVHHDSFVRIGALFKIVYSDLMSLRVASREKKQFNSRISKNNLGKRIKPTKSRF